MSIRSTRVFSPDGLSSARPVTSPAKGQDFPVTDPTLSGPQGPQRRHSAETDQFCHNQDGYDDGLVHGHYWAASDR